MAYITPNSTLRIHKSVPITRAYSDTIYFANRQNQVAYFSGSAITKYTLNNLSYQRADSNKIRIEKKADDIYDCNYISFQNTAYGTKWFYAFIIDVSYINDKTSEITYEIDVLQTYLLDLVFKRCWIERQHVINDSVGANTNLEEVEIGNIKCYETGDIGTSLLTDLRIVMFFANTTEPFRIGKTGGLFSGLAYNTFPFTSSGISMVLDKINEYTEKPDEIVGIFILPSTAIATDGINSIYQLSKPTAIGNYVPRNKKLLCYPYSFLSVDAQGGSNTYRYEWFDLDYCSFRLLSGGVPNTEVALMATNYNGAIDDVSGEIIISGYPQCAWSSDSFKQYIALNGTSALLSAGGSLLSMGVGLATGNPVAVAGGALGLGQTVASIVASSKESNRSHGSNGTNVDLANGNLTFHYHRMGVDEERAKILDDFFDMFGYSVQRVGLPSYWLRPTWNYVKTRGAIASGGAPAQAIEKICQIFDNGIRFWKDASTVGDYTQNNQL